MFDYAISKINRYGEVTETNIDRAFQISSYYIPLEKIFVKYYESKNIEDHDCKKLNIYADRLIAINVRSSQAYFVKAVCKEKFNDLNLALIDAENALKYDQFNTTYLLTLAILNLNLNNLTETKKYINLIESIDPLTNNLEIVKNALRERS